MQPGDRGDAIRDLQRALQRAADPLPNYGADGNFGGETLAAATEFCSRLGLDYDGGTIPAQALAELGLSTFVQATASTGVRVYDLRSEAPDPHPKARQRNGRTVRRDASAITGIVLHQADVEFDPPAKDPSDLGLARRALKVACHAMAFDGFVSLAAPELWHVYQADGLNPTTLGLEVNGTFPGLLSREDGHSVLTPGLVAAAREGVRMLVENARAIGCPIRWIYAHRQADSWRRADPGEGLWRAVVLDYAVPVLGLVTRPGYSLPDPQRDPKRHGLTIPRAWDPDGVGNY